MNSLHICRTVNGHSGDGVTTPATPSKERRVPASARGILSTAEVVNNAYDAAKGAHAIVVCTEWDEFK
jgi:UDP-glucose 6-dehydrogenase